MRDKSKFPHCVILLSFGISTFSGICQLECKVNGLFCEREMCILQALQKRKVWGKPFPSENTFVFTWKYQRVTEDGSWWFPISLPNYSLVWKGLLCTDRGSVQSRPSKLNGWGCIPPPLLFLSLGTQLIFDSLCGGFRNDRCCNYTCNSLAWKG